MNPPPPDWRETVRLAAEDLLRLQAAAVSETHAGRPLPQCSEKRQANQCSERITP